MCLIKKSYIPRITLSNKTVYKIVVRTDKSKYITAFVGAEVDCFKINKAKFQKSNLFQSLFCKNIYDGYIHAYEKFETA